MNATLLYENDVHKNMHYVRGVFFQYKDRDPSAVIIFTI